MNRILAYSVICSFLLTLYGCAAPKKELSRAEWIALTTRDYQGLDNDRVLKAAERLFRLADGSDFSLVHSETGIDATRNWSMYYVFGFTNGVDFWRVTTTPLKEGTRVRIQLQTQNQRVIPTVTPTQSSVYTQPTTGSHVMGTAIYDLFWARMDYLLGRRSDWMTCAIADERVKKGIVWGENEALCNSFNMLDSTPVANILDRNPR